MMKSILTALLIGGLAASTAFAQTPAPAAPAAKPAAAAPAVTGKMKAKEVRAGCRDEAKAQGLKGAARKATVKECFARERPDLAKKAECRTEGKSKGLAGTELKAFVKQCAPGKA